MSNAIRSVLVFGLILINYSFTDSYHYDDIAEPVPLLRAHMLDFRCVK
jgi:hypothetical protein